MRGGHDERGDSPGRPGRRDPAPSVAADLAWRLLSSLLLLALAIGAMLLGGEAAAENRSLQVVGVQPLDASAERAGGPRQGAVNQALYEAVSRVALDLVAEYGPALPSQGGALAGEDAGGDGGEAGLEENQLKSVLGRDMTPFARSFRIVEDQGSRPVLFPGESEATREYVVVVDVTVDVDRVRGRLSEHGLIAVEDADGDGLGLEIDVLGLRHWSGFEAFMALLASPAVGASDVQPLEFEAGRALVFASVEGDPQDVLARLMAAAPADLEISGRTGGPAGDSTGSGEFDRDGPGTGARVPRLELIVLWTPPATPSR